MTPAELLRAAEMVKGWHETCGGCGNPYRGTSHNVNDDTVSLADHVLSTVREDDGEEITGEWLNGFAKGEATGVWNIDTKKIRNDVWVISQKDGWELSWQDYEDNNHGEWPYLLKTRGQLRRLLEGLGVV